VAAEYAAAGDVDPRVGEHLLDVLALDGIAAYLRPSTDLHPVTRTAHLPDRPTDRLFVDRTHLTTARDYLARLAADSTDENEPDVDRAWAQIVAGYHTEVGPERGSWPAAEDVPDRAIGHDRPVGPPGPPAVRVSPAEEGSLLDGLDTFGAGLPDESDEGYTPPPPPPLPHPSAATVLAIIGVIGGFVVFLQPRLLPFGEGTSVLLGFGAIIAGFVTLVLRLRPGDDEDDDDPDDGARV
jgi:hypothetical protein